MGDLPTQKKDMSFDTSQWYAAFAGWLILPFMFTLFALLGAVIMYIYVDPTELSGFDLNVYYADIVTIPYLLIAYIFWVRRKRTFPLFMIAYFIFTAVVTVTYYINGYPFDPVNLAMSIIWIFYFLRSKRVKATFTW